MISRFFRYVDKVFDFGALLATVRDSRAIPRIPSGAIFVSAMTMFLTRRKSLHAIEPILRLPARLAGLVGKLVPSADRMGDVFAMTDTAPLREMLSKILHKLGRNKVLKTVWPLRALAIDGHEFFSGGSRHCDACRTRTLKTKNGDVTQYYHLGVVCALVDDDNGLPLDVEMVRPGEGEVAAAKRLLQRVLPSYGRMIDVIVGDAIYLEAPFFNFCLDRGKHVIAVLKGNNPALLADARGLVPDVEPVKWKTPDRTITAWDIPQLETNAAMKQPLRVLHTEEILDRPPKRASRKPDPEDEDSHWWWATTIPRTHLSTRALAEVGHRRWDIENKVFNTLVNHWAMNHCYKHHPVAIVNFILTLFITFILVQAFYKRNLKAPMRAIYRTLISIGDALYASLLAGPVPRPWNDEPATAPT